MRANPQSMPVSPMIKGAIIEAVKAGVFRRAARLNPKSAKVWNDLAKPHSETVAALLLAFSYDDLAKG